MFLTVSSNGLVRNCIRCILTHGFQS